MISKSAKMKGPQNTPKFLFNEYPRHTMKNTFYSFTVLQFYSFTVLQFYSAFWINSDISHCLHLRQRSREGMNRCVISWFNLSRFFFFFSFVCQKFQTSLHQEIWFLVSFLRFKKKVFRSEEMTNDHSHTYHQTSRDLHQRSNQNLKPPKN
jgi:hypothetical protein